VLVLSRKPGETIHLGDHIIVTVLEVKGNHIRLGFEAPASCAILRGELREAGERPSIPPPASR
jgi:carbon storage regulator